MRKWRRTPSTGRNFQTSIIWITLSLKRQVVMVQFLSIICFLGFLQFLLGFSKFPVFLCHSVLTLFLNPFRHIGYYIHHCCNRNLFACWLLISEQTAVTSLYRINTWFTLLLETLITVNRVETKFLRIYYVIIVLQRIKWCCPWNMRDKFSVTQESKSGLDRLVIEISRSHKHSQTHSR